MMGYSLANESDCYEMQTEFNFSKKVEYIDIYEIQDLGVNSAIFGGADLSKQYVFGEND